MTLRTVARAAAPAWILVLALGSVARADDAEVPSLELRGWSPSADPAGGMSFEPASTPATLDWNAALWQSYSWRPVVLRDPEADEVAVPVLAHQYGGDIVLNVGFFERLALGFDLPFALYQAGDDPTPEALATLGPYEVPGQALGDVKILAKVTIIQPTNAEFGGFAMAIHERLGLPSGDATSFMGEGALKSETRLLLEYRYVAFGVHGSLGATLRTEEQRFGCNSVPVPIDEETDDPCGTIFGHEIPWGLAITILPQAIGIDNEGRWTWFVESWGYVPASPSAPFTNAALSQAQIGGGVRVELVEDLSLVAGIDAALVPGIGTAPVHGVLALAWAPREHDMDHDGVKDDVDLCPEDLPEDKDGYQDEDGCPEWDNDEDGVPDGQDRCSTKKEDEDGYQDGDGCPDPDNDGDGVLDADDACRDQKGARSPIKEKNGCPDVDPDQDRVEGDADKCPAQPEDPDGFEDGDGCPEADNDKDGLDDRADACPDLAGVRYPSSPKDDGCPDADGDGIADGKDACKAEKGVASDDPQKNGCPEAPKEAPPKQPKQPKAPKEPKQPKAPKAPPKEPKAPKAPPK
jgi:OmpA-OmpF porin, OOP family